MARPSIAPIPKAPAEYDPVAMQEILNTIETRLSDIERVKTKTFTVTNEDPLREFDVSSNDLPTTNRVLGTLISTLKKIGTLG